MVDCGFFGVSVFAALDGDIRTLCETIPRLRSPGTIWVASAGTVRSAGFRLLPTDAERAIGASSAAVLASPACVRTHAC